TMSASTSRRWIRPPTVGSATTPRSHRMRSTRTIVQSMAWAPPLLCTSRKVRAMAARPAHRRAPYRFRVRQRLLFSAAAAPAVALLALVLIAIYVRVALPGHLHAEAAPAPAAPVTLVLGAEVYAD